MINHEVPISGRHDIVRDRTPSLDAVDEYQRHQMMGCITRLINFVESRRQHSSGRDQPVTYREESS